METDIELHLSLEGDALKVTAANTGTREVRLWSRDNSWGWGMLSLRVAAPGSDRWLELTAKPVRWTRNLPSAVAIPAGGATDYLLRAGDPGWEGADLAGLAAGPLQVRVRLHADTSPEAQAQGVFTGDLQSAAIVSQPPHRWLA
jgi:hypothetical protein